MRVIQIGLAGLLQVSLAAPLQAHEGHDAIAASPSGWDMGILAGLATAGWLYARGSRRLAGRGARVRGAERAAFWFGWVAAFVSLMPQVDAAAARLFSVHMAQHEMLMLVVAPLMIAGRPIVPWLWALPDRARLRGGRLFAAKVITAGWGVMTLPLVAWAVHGAVIWIWHAPALYEAAIRSEGVHALQHGMFVGTAVLFWWGLVYGRYGRAAYGAAVLYVFATLLHTGLLGAMFALSDRPFYPLYVQRAAAAGADAVADQQLAGLYMWVPSGIVLTLFGLALFTAWLAEAGRRNVRAPKAAGDGGLTRC
jgi:cytochrome c oxidase assembly factor CtaG